MLYNIVLLTKISCFTICYFNFLCIAKWFSYTQIRILIFSILVYPRILNIVSGASLLIQYHVLDKTIIRKNTCTLVFIAAWFMTAKTWKQPKHPLTDEWIKKIFFYPGYLPKPGSNPGLPHGRQFLCTYIGIYTYIHVHIHIHIYVFIVI